MADMDSMSVWRVASGGSELGMAWRDAVARRIMRSPTCTPYDGLVADQAAPLACQPTRPGAPFASGDTCGPGRTPRRWRASTCLRDHLLAQARHAGGSAIGPSAAPGPLRRRARLVQAAAERIPGGVSHGSAQSPTTRPSWPGPRTTRQGARRRRAGGAGSTPRRRASNARSTGGGFPLEGAQSAMSV